MACPGGGNENPQGAVAGEENLGFPISTPLEESRSNAVNFSPKEEHTQTSASEGPKAMQAGFAPGGTGFLMLAWKPMPSWAEQTRIWPRTGNQYQAGRWGPQEAEHLAGKVPWQLDGIYHLEALDCAHLNDRRQKRGY